MINTIKSQVEELKAMEGRIVEITNSLIANGDITEFDGEILDAIDKIKCAIENLEEEFEN